LPTFLPACVLFALAFERGLAGLAKIAGYALLCYVVFVNFFWAAAWFTTYDAEAVVLGAQSSDDYLSRAHPSYGDPYYPCARFINESLPAQARVMVLGDERGYYLDRDYVASTVFAEHPLKRYLAESASPEALRERLRREGLTHFLINAGKVREKGVESWLKLDAAESKTYGEFARRYLREVYADREPGQAAARCAVYELARE
jgi:hypothetical protein